MRVVFQARSVPQPQIFLEVARHATFPIVWFGKAGLKAINKTKISCSMRAAC